MNLYKNIFNKYKISLSQILITLEDTEKRRRAINAKRTFENLFDLNYVPIVNENDSIATSEIKYGDNDRLASRVAQILGADCLILLSDVDGLYSSNPKINKNAKLIYMSSSEVYGNIKKNKINENEYGYIDPMKSNSCYSLSKKVAENIVMNYYKKYRLKIRIIRLFHVIGYNSDKSDNRLFSDLMNNFLNSKRIIKIYSSAKIKRSYCYILDVLIAILAVLKKGSNGEAYNVGNPKNRVTTKELISLISKNTNYKKKIKFVSLVKKNFYFKKNYYPNLNKIKKLGWKPKVNLSESIRRISQYY